MQNLFTQTAKSSLTPIYAVVTDSFDEWKKGQPVSVQQWVATAGFKAKSGSYCLVPSQDGQFDSVLLGIKNNNDFLAFGALSAHLPEGCYEIKNFENIQLAALAWGLGAYQFSKYKSHDVITAALFLPSNINEKLLQDWLSSIYLARDLINTPAEDMGPADIEAAVKKIAKEFSADFSAIIGDKLLKENYPSIHAVGRASPREPRVIDLRWGDKKNPKITLVGKGVCFDTGGLDLKSASGMLLMKKDMAGSAMMLALARMIMSQNLPIQLRLLIGAVDNAVSGNAYRPGDVFKTRSGKTIEIKNTDAEGRVVLCDLLTEACSESPELIIDFATLTGAARVALGEDIPAFFTRDDELAEKLMTSSKKSLDTIWRLPLFSNYREKLHSEIADIATCSDSPWGGSITAALYLKSFVDKNIPWVHFDTPAWNHKTKPSRPAGAEVFAIRAVFDYLRDYRA